MSLEKIEAYLARVNLPCDLNVLPTSACLVGGSVRDALLGRYRDKIDLDIVVPENAIALAREISQSYSGGFVVLDEAREIARVVFPQGTLDIALQEGDSLEKDLHRRDFTINAIAYNIRRQQPIDPLDGVADLDRGILKTIAVGNLKDDPLRLLRAYRQAAQLDFTIEPETRSAIRSLAPLLNQIAAERVQAELSYLLATPLGNKWLAAAWEDRLLDFWLPSIDRVKIERLNLVETAAEKIEKCPAEWVYLAKIAILVAQDAEIAEIELNNLKYSRSQLRAVVNTVKYLPQLANANASMSLREQYFLFLDIKEVFPILAISAIACGVSSKTIDPLIARYFNPRDRVAHPQPLVTGKDLITALKIAPSPTIGKLLSEIQIAYVENKISSYDEAIEFASGLLRSL